MLKQQHDKGLPLYLYTSGNDATLLWLMAIPLLLYPTHAAAAAAVPQLASLHFEYVGMHV